MTIRIIEVEIGGKRVELKPIDESPCRRACPAGIDVKRYVGQIASGDFAGALETIRRHMPFPSVCGRICLHPCETECTRSEIDLPIAIMHLKRFAIDYESQKGEPAPLPAIAKPTGKQVAIIGSGPAGLTAAHDLALMGHKVTVFERADVPGGMLTRAIPEFHLPSKAVLRDIERIEKLGVEIKLNHPIDSTHGLSDLKKDGFDTVLIATGASARWSGMSGTGWIEGSGLRGIQGAAEFMISHRKCHNGEVEDAPCKVAVLGYGVQALACARECVRLGAAEVYWIIPFDRAQLQPDPRLIVQAEAEGVKIIERTRPLAIEGSDGKVTGIRCASVELGDPDHTGRRFWHDLPGRESVISVGSVIDAAYSEPDSSWDALSTAPWGTIAVDLDTMATQIPGVFAAGDVASGPKSSVEAIAQGHRAAAGIDRYLSGEKEKIGTLSEPIRVHGWGIDDPDTLPSKAFRPGVRPPELRVEDFDEVELPFTSWQATHEARRCLLCGPCEECAVCIGECSRKKACAEDENGQTIIVRVPLGVAQSLYGSPDTAPDIGLLTARVDPARCRACGVCEELCGYHAPRVGLQPNGIFASSIDILACKGCGTCVAACPSGAIDQGMTSLHAVRSAINGGKE